MTGPIIGEHGPELVHFARGGVVQRPADGSDSVPAFLDSSYIVPRRTAETAAPVRPAATWDILLPTLPHRHEQMCALLAELDRQHQPGMSMILYRDNLQRRGDASYGKWQDLQEMSRADYTSFIGDDDWVAPDFVARVMAALEGTPDYVGFPVRYTFDGELQLPVEHSLRHGGWSGDGQMLRRDIVHHNPIRRDLALLAAWRTTEQTADVAWASDLRATGRVVTEAWIPEPMYWYQETSRSWSRVSSGGLPEPMAADEIKPLPAYPWLTVRDEALA